MTMNSEEKHNMRRLLAATFLNGFVVSLGALQDIIAKKALGALDWQIALLAVVWPVSNFFSIWWGKILERSQNKAPYMKNMNGMSESIWSLKSQNHGLNARIPSSETT